MKTEDSSKEENVISNDRNEFLLYFILNVNSQLDKSILCQDTG